ncbi:MAG TPA: hypothetical protein VIR16_10725 [Candidatus Limnocylindrales bacterium]
MTNGRLVMRAGVVAVAAVLGAAGYDGVCDHVAAAEAEQRSVLERQRWAAQRARDLAEQQALGADAVFGRIAEALAELERDGETALDVSADLARAREVFPADERGPALHARHGAFRARQHAAHQGAAATLAYLQAIGLP